MKLVSSQYEISTPSRKKTAPRPPPPRPAPPAPAAAREAARSYVDRHDAPNQQKADRLEEDDSGDQDVAVRGVEHRLHQIGAVPVEEEPDPERQAGDDEALHLPLAGEGANFSFEAEPLANR